MLKQVLEESIIKYVDDLIDNQDPAKTNLIPPAVRREKIKNEVQHALDLNPFRKHIGNAVKILRNDGKKYLSSEEYIALLKSLVDLHSSLESPNLDKSYKEIVHIPMESCQSILKIGIVKFKEKHFENALSIFAFLVSLEANNPDYWYRLGIAAQEGKHYDLALHAYAEVLHLAPEFIDARIFIVQCYVESKQREKAIAKFAEIKKLLKTNQKGEIWRNLLRGIENLITR